MAGLHPPQLISTHKKLLLACEVAQQAAIDAQERCTMLAVTAAVSDSTAGKQIEKDKITLAVTAAVSDSTAGISLEEGE